MCYFFLQVSNSNETSPNLFGTTRYFSIIKLHADAAPGARGTMPPPRRSSPDVSGIASDVPTRCRQLRRLDPQAEHLIRASVAITSVAQALEELAQNALDASASQVLLRMNVAEFSITVHDNGHGIAPAGMALVGEPNTSSKCRSLNDLDAMSQACTFGFRGQALSAIAQVSTCEVITRARGADLSWSKMLRGGKTLHCQPLVAVAPRSTHGGWVRQHTVNHYGISAYGSGGGGTSVFVRDLFFNQPVRRRRLSPELEVQDAVNRLRCLAVVHPHVEFSLVDESTSRTVFRQCQRANATLKQSFHAVFGRNRSWNLVASARSFPALGGLRVDALCTTAGHGARSKDLQLVFVNRRFVRSPRIQKLMNTLLTTNEFRHRHGVDGREALLSPGVSSGGVSSGVSGSYCGVKRSVSRATSGLANYPVYMLCLTLEAWQYDVLSGPDKTRVEFWDLDGLLNALQIMFDPHKETIDSSLEGGGRPATEMARSLLVTAAGPVAGLTAAGETRPRSMAQSYSAAAASFSSGSCAISGEVVPAAPWRPRPSVIEMLRSHGERQISAPAPEAVAQVGSRLRKPPTSSLKTIIREEGICISPLPARHDPGSVGQSQTMQLLDRVSLAGGSSAAVSLSAGVLREARVIGQADSKFLLLRCEADGSLLCVDQHAADERVQLEDFDARFRAALPTMPFTSGCAPWSDPSSAHSVTESRSHVLGVHTLADPLVLELLPQEEERVRMYKDELLRWNFGCVCSVPQDHSQQNPRPMPPPRTPTGTETLLSLFSGVVGGGATCDATSSLSSASSMHQQQHFGQRQLVVAYLPTLFGIELTVADMRMFLQELADGRCATRPSFVTRCLNSLACKRAVRFGESLSLERAETLVQRLSGCRLPFQCAHGRPSVVPLAHGNISAAVGTQWRRAPKRRKVATA